MIEAGGWIGLFIILIGMVLLIVGVVFHETYLTENRNISWWIWTLIVLGIIISVIGLIITFIFLKQPEINNSNQYNL